MNGKRVTGMILAGAVAASLFGSGICGGAGNGNRDIR